MSRSAFAGIVAALVVTGFGDVFPAAGQEQKHSGVIVEVGPGGQSITVEEMGPWTGPESQPQRQIVGLTSRTRIEVVSRSERAPASGGWPGGFTASGLTAAELRAGDLATVTTRRLAGELIAESIAVVRPAGDLFPPGEPTARAASHAR